MNSGFKYVIVLILASFPFISYISRGMLFYIILPVYWMVLAVATIRLCGFKPSLASKTPVIVGLVTAILCIVILIDAGLITGFGKSPYTHTPTGILVNSFYVTSMLLGMEFSRAYLLSKTRNPTQAIILATLLYTFIQIPPAKLLTLTELTPLKVVEFTGSQLLTSLASNLMASTLALLGGSLASLAYRAPIEAFWWFSPILPDLTWGWKSLIGVIPPILGFITLIHEATPVELRKLGIRPEKAGGLKAIKRERKEALWTVAMCMAIILTVWFSTGLLGVFPTVAISGSMRPTIDVGDLLIMVKVPAEKITPGDIIQYVTERGMVVHRVIAIERGYFITKGDANEAPDPDPVHPLNVRGKLIAIIPK
ncbi:MAG: signal peptidase I, partial [Archaeoglobales archaeon]